MSFASFNPSKVLFDNGATLDAARSVARRWVAAFNARDIDDLAELYDPEAALFAGPDAAPVVGSGALRRFFTALEHFQPEVRLTHAPEARRLSDRSAFLEGQYEFARGNGAWVKANFRFLLVRHIRNWRISEHHSTILPIPVA